MNNFNLTGSNPNAWVVSSKDNGRKSIKNGNIYLKDSEEFKIELHNPLTVQVAASIKLNGEYISTSLLIINPGQRIYLDCFIETKEKFVFKTYNVDDNQENKNAIKNNGAIEISFFKNNIYRNYNIFTSVNQKFIKLHFHHSNHMQFPQISRIY